MQQRDERPDLSGQGAGRHRRPPLQRLRRSGDALIRHVLALGALAISGCATNPGGLPPRTASVEGSWQVVEVKRQATPATADYRIAFENGQIGARFGCNHMGGRFRQAGNVVHAGQISTTLMGCPEPAATIERDAGLIFALPMSISWISRDQLELSNRAGGIKLVRVR